MELLFTCSQGHVFQRNFIYTERYRILTVRVLQKVFDIWLRSYVLLLCLKPHLSNDEFFILKQNVCNCLRLLILTKSKNLII